MKRRTEDLSAKLPLLEAVLVILIFVILSASVLSIYLGADRLMKKAEANGRGMILAENLCEAFRVAELDADGSIRYSYAGRQFLLPAKGETNLILDTEASPDSFNISITTDSTVGEADGVLVTAEVSVSTEDEPVRLRTAVILDRR